MNEQEKMLAGKIYNSNDKTLVDLRAKAHKLSKQYNDTFDTEESKRNEIIDELWYIYNSGIKFICQFQFYCFGYLSGIYW